jgi:hypothetical protein
VKRGFPCRKSRSPPDSMTRAIWRGTSDGGRECRPGWRVGRSASSVHKSLCHPKTARKVYMGAWRPAKDGSGHEFPIGPHLMVVSPHQDDFQNLNHDPSNGMPYVTHLPNRTELFLVMPIRQWMSSTSMYEGTVPQQAGGQSVACRQCPCTSLNRIFSEARFRTNVHETRSAKTDVGTPLL